MIGQDASGKFKTSAAKEPPPLFSRAIGLSIGDFIESQEGDRQREELKQIDDSFYDEMEKSVQPWDPYRDWR